MPRGNPHFSANPPQRIMVKFNYTPVIPLRKGYNEILVESIIPQSSREFKKITAERITELQIPKYHANAPKYQFDTLELYFFLLPLRKFIKT